MVDFGLLLDNTATSSSPVVPPFHCHHAKSILCSGGRIRTGDLPIMSRMLSPTELRRLDYRALCGNRTHHLFLTMEVLYRMS